MAEPAAAVGGGVVAKALGGLFVSGLIMALPGAMLPVWRHHIESNFLSIGACFLAQIAGLVSAPFWAARALRARDLANGMCLASIVATMGLLMVVLFAPPYHAAWRVAGLFVAGSAAGLMNLSVFRAVSAAYERQPAATVNLAGVFFGLGSLLSAVVVSAGYYFYEAPSSLFLLVLLPLCGVPLCLRWRVGVPAIEGRLTWKAAVEDFRNPAAILLALLLFFECGNEGALAGWLPLYLIRITGCSPALAIFLLALFWLALLVGRIIAQALLKRIRHSRMLLWSVSLGMFGCLILAFTNNLFGAVTGVLLCGGAFSMIIPLAVERIGDRFPYFRIGMFNGIFSIALVGGGLAPASLGLFAYLFGINVVMILPAVGSVMVLVLVLLIFLEAHLHAARVAALDAESGGDS